MKYFRALVLALFVVIVGTTYAHAGTIDPRNVGYWKALMESSALSSAPTVNFGKFTTPSASPYNITVSDTELRGYAWGEGIGWLVVNCADTTSGCVPANSSFRVSNDGNGNLSGYAWGENTGWINFGPFSNPGISTVKITNGLFGGSLGNAGYAWTQNYGWMKFDCSNPASCVETDWGVPVDPPDDDPPKGIPDCRDGRDNDADGLIDQFDPGCHTDGDASNPLSYDRDDNNEINTISATYICSNGIDDDLDGLIDYQNDPGCNGNPFDMDETDTGGPSYCELNPTARECTGGPIVYVCSDGEDNDRDGLTDYDQDPGCNNNPQGNSEVNTNNPSFCQLNPTHPRCITTIPPRCDDGVQNQGETGIDVGGPCDTTDPWICDLFPLLPTCNPIGPDRDPDPNPDVRVPSGDTSVIRWLTWAGLSLPVASAVVSFIVSNPIVLKDLPLLAMQLWNALLIALGWKERKKPWGVVYDSVTKRPIDPAYVVLMDMNGNEVATAITDINGRYGFAVDPGTYRIVANKSNYQFPSTKLAGKSSDGLYDELYFGGEVVISKEGEIITKNIPLDQLAFDWNEYAKQTGGTYSMKLAFYRNADIVLFHLSRILFMLGFAYAIYVVIFSPIVYNIVILALYVVMALVQTFASGFHKKGSVLSKDTKKPLPYSVVRIISAVTNKEVAHKVADRVGNYYGLVQNGLYTFTVDTKKSTEEGYDVHSVDKYVKVKKGYLKETFKI